MTRGHGRSAHAAGRASLGLILVLGALSAFAPLSLDMYLPGLPELGRGLATSVSAAQLTLTACLAGLALGQLVAGPLSDRFGRRRPLLTGLGAYTVASILCALAPSVAVLVPLRFMQGLAGAAGIVISRAIVRDMHSGVAAARLFSALMMVSGSAPILAPVFGGQLLAFTSWRGIFVVLAGIGVVLIIVVATKLKETLPGERRHAGGFRATSTVLREIAADRVFVVYALAGGLVLGAMFAYIAGSPFVLQEIYGLSEQEFSAVFAINGAGIVLASLLTRRLLRRCAPITLVRVGTGASIVGSALVFAAVTAFDAGVAPVLAGLFIAVAAVGIVSPTTAAIALADHGSVAGSASALLGVLHYLLGAVAAPLVGVAGKHTAIPMGALMLASSVGAGALLRITGRPPAATASPPTPQ
jgi:DHA1 family bicyclomycin/chloramphenicol resistance-like MFS transporter